MGWYKNSDYTKKVTKITASTIGNKTFYAKWKKVSVSRGKINKGVNKSGKKVKLILKKVSGADGYVIKYTTNSNMKNAKYVSTTKTTKTITGLKKGTTYYFKVKAYKKDSTGTKVYGKLSKKVKVTVTK